MVRKTGYTVCIRKVDETHKLGKCWTVFRTYRTMCDAEHAVEVMGTEEVRARATRNRDGEVIFESTAHLAVEPITPEPKVVFGIEDVPGYFEAEFRYENGEALVRVFKAHNEEYAEKLAQKFARCDAVASNAGLTLVSVEPLTARVEPLKDHGGKW